MTFSIRTITRALSRRNRGIRFGPERWTDLLAELDRRGERRHEVMGVIAKTLSDQDIEAEQALSQY